MTLVPSSPQQDPQLEMARGNLITQILTGSHLYGTSTPESDKDYMGVFVPMKSYVMGTKVCEQVEVRTNPTGSGRMNTKADTDMTLFGLPKYVKLLTANNPNIIETLFAPERNLVFVNELGRLLIAHQKLFVSKRVKHTFLGYAFEQKRKLITKNPTGDRKKYIDQFGYDVKYASHLIRLLTEGLELLVEGKLTFPLSNANYIRDIKLGKYSMDHVLSETARYEQLVEAAYVSSPLPHTPDHEGINQLQMRIMEKHWYGEY